MNPGTESAEPTLLLYGEDSGEVLRSVEQACYWQRRNAGKSYAEIGKRFWPGLEPWQRALWASSAASRYAVRAGVRWPLGDV
jgi:hypothetical protein